MEGGEGRGKGWGRVAGGGREDGKERRRERGGGMPGELELLQPQP